MMSIAFHNYQRDVLPIIPVVGNDVIRHGSVIQTNNYPSLKIQHSLFLTTLHHYLLQDVI